MNKIAPFATPADEAGFIADARELTANVMKKARYSLPAWQQRAIDNQFERDLSDLAEIVSATPATLHLQAEALRRLIDRSLPAGTLETILIKSLCAGLAELAGTPERKPSPL